VEQHEAIIGAVVAAVRADAGDRVRQPTILARSEESRSGDHIERTSAEIPTPRTPTLPFPAWMAQPGPWIDGRPTARAGDPAVFLGDASEVVPAG
jgi:hypothetical protein